MSLQIYNDVKDIVLDVIGAYNPTDVVIGTLLSLSPVKVEVDGNSELYPSSSFLIPDSMNGKEIPAIFSDEEGEHNGTLKIEPQLKEGDVVIMLKCQQGQKLLIMDKVSG